MLLAESFVVFLFVDAGSTELDSVLNINRVLLWWWLWWVEWWRWCTWRWCCCCCCWCRWEDGMWWTWLLLELLLFELLSELEESLRLPPPPPPPPPPLVGPRMSTAEDDEEEWWCVLLLLNEPVDGEECIKWCELEPEPLWLWWCWGVAYDGNDSFPV